MSIMIQLALRQLLLNKRRTIITLMGIILSVSMVTAVIGFVVSTQDMMRRTYIMHNGDYHVSFLPVTEQDALAIATDERVEASYIKEVNGENGIFIRIKNVDRGYYETAEKVAVDYGVVFFSANKELLAAEGIIASDQSLMTVYYIGMILAVIILTGSVIVISNAFYISASERVRQFGILKSIGATKQQIRQTVLAEGFALSVIGIPLGILFGFAIEFIALQIANALLYEVSQLNDGMIQFHMIMSGWAILISIVISLVTIFLSAWLPAGKASKITAIDAIRLSNDVKIKPGQVRSFGITEKLFGFEGALASKSLKRSKGKYRAAVIALVLSITLFIVSSGFGNLVTKSTEMVYTDYGINVLMQYKGDSHSTGIVDELHKEINSLPDADVYFTKSATTQIPLPDSFLSEEGIKHLPDTAMVQENMAPVKIISLEDSSFEEMCRYAGINKDSFQEGQVEGILVNTAIRDYAGKRIEFKPFAFTPGQQINMSDSANQAYDITLVAQASQVTASVMGVAGFDEISIIVPMSQFDTLTANMSARNASWFALAKNPTLFTDRCEDIFKSLADEGDYIVYNYEKGARMSSNIGLLMMIFVYGFIGMLSLIAVTSVISTISTGISLRAQEFAMLASVGMTPEGLRRMLNLESLLYGIKALWIGLPIGMFLYYLLYKAFFTSIEFAFTWPWRAIMVSVVAVLFLTFCTMRYLSKKLADRSIIATLKDSNL